MILKTVENEFFFYLSLTLHSHTQRLIILKLYKIRLSTRAEVSSSHTHLIVIDLQRCLVRAECDEALPVRGELSQEAGRLLYVDEGEVREDVGVEAAVCVDAAPPVARPKDLAGMQAKSQILGRNSTWQ